MPRRIVTGSLIWLMTRSIRPSLSQIPEAYPAGDVFLLLIAADLSAGVLELAAEVAVEHRRLFPARPICPDGAG